MKSQTDKINFYDKATGEAARNSESFSSKGEDNSEEPERKNTKRKEGPTTLDPAD